MRVAVGLAGARRIRTIIPRIIELVAEIKPVDEYDRRADGFCERLTALILPRERKRLAIQFLPTTGEHQIADRPANWPRDRHVSPSKLNRRPFRFFRNSVASRCKRTGFRVRVIDLSNKVEWKLIASPKRESIARSSGRSGVPLRDRSKTLEPIQHQLIRK